MVRHLIVGAGASYAECKAANLADELCLPLINNFGQKMWADYNPVLLLHAYLNANGINVPADTDARTDFFELERTRRHEFNIELFFEYAWRERFRFPGEWENLIYHGILNPLVFLLSQGLWSKGIIDAPLQLSPNVARRLNAGDVILDLNYDTLFEIGALQAGKQITFLPNTPSQSSLWVAKPHGSINMVVNNERHSFAFGDLDWPGSPQPSDGSKNYAGFIPPRFNKNFSEHPVARTILASLNGSKPAIVTFWGVGFTDSDIDLSELYAAWCVEAKAIEVINPDRQISEILEKRFGNKVQHFGGVESWLGNG